MKGDLNDLKKLTLELMKNDNFKDVQEKNEQLIQKIYKDPSSNITETNHQVLSLSEASPQNENIEIVNPDKNYDFIEDVEEEQEEETFSLHDKELELIKKSLLRHNGKRKHAAEELGISERTLYRKIKQYDL